MLKVGQRVRHRRFGTGTLHETHTQQDIPTGLVQWDTHRVTRPWNGYSEAYSWVYLRSLTPYQPARLAVEGRA